MDNFEKYKLEKSLVALWLSELRLSIGNRFGTLYYTDEELLEWAKVNIKQLQVEDDPHTFYVFYGDEFLFKASEMSYHKAIKNEQQINLN